MKKDDEKSVASSDGKLRMGCERNGRAIGGVGHFIGTF